MKVLERMKVENYWNGNGFGFAEGEGEHREDKAELHSAAYGREGTDWLAAAAGNQALAEELRTGRCRCGKMLGDVEGAEGCAWHEAGRRRVASALRTAWSGGGGAGPRGEDMELLCRFMPKEMLFVYEVLVHRGLVIGGGALRGGRGYDESVVPGTGKAVGGMAATRSGVVERRMAAGAPAKRGSSAKPVVRSEEAVVYRRKIDRRLRRIAREMLVWLEEGVTSKVLRRCTRARCGLFAEDGWNFCPVCGGSVEDFERRSG